MPHQLQSLTDVPNNLTDPHLDYGLYLLDEVLAGMGKSLHDYQLPHYSHNWGNSSANPLLAEQLDYDSQREQLLRNERYAQLNIDQKHCFDIILDHVNEHPETAYFFVHGPAGTGKTFLYKVLCNHFRAEGKIVLCVAFSGIVALLLPGGITSHSRFKIPLNVFEDSVCDIKRNTQLHSLIQRTTLIIWDEVPMQHKHCFVAVHRTLTDLLDNKNLFGGIPVVLGGDFAQILPVVRKGTRATIVQANIQRSFMWPKFQKLFLQQNMRIRHGAANESFAEWIGKMSYDPSLSGNIKLLDTVQQLQTVQSFKDTVFLVAEFAEAHSSIEFFTSRCVLALRNDICTEWNSKILDDLQRDCSSTLDSADRILDETSASHRLDFLPTEFLRTLDTASLAPAQLRLKLGAPVMLLRNLTPPEGMCNGTRLRLTHIGRFILEGQILGGERHGQKRLIPRILMNTTEGELPWIISQKQFPIRLCFAMTVNKSQSQSLDTVGVDLCSPAFTHGQLYVALS